MSDDGGLGARLRAARHRKGWTLEQLAREAGTSKGFISTVENGHSQPTGRVLMGLARALQTSVDHLMGAANAGPSEAPPPARIEIPEELAEVAEHEQWTFRKVRAVLEARRAVLARRSDQLARPFTMSEWRDFAKRLEPYLDPDPEE